MAFFLVKLKKADAKPALVEFDERPTLDQIFPKVVSLFQIPRNWVTITFCNAGKQFDVTNEEKLQEAYKSLEPCANQIKFVVQDSHSSNTTISSTWSAGSNLSDLSMAGTFQLACWVFKTTDQPFLMDVGVNEKVDNLKRSLKSVLEYPHPYFRLRLWKLSPSVLLSRYAALAKLQSPEEIPGCVMLNPTDVVSEHFLSPSIEHLHIIVVAPLPSPHFSTDKRKTGFEPEAQYQMNGNALGIKRFKFDYGVEDNRLPSEGTLAKYHEMVHGVHSDPEWYSNPRTCNWLPFPFKFPSIPERFSLQHDRFEYMGREIFQEVLDKVSSLSLSGLTKLYIYGTMGYGKSYILAALTCLLYRQGKRVVFIPDCRAMLPNPLLYLKCALLCAFANPSLKEERQQIRACTSVSELDAFSHSLHGTTLYFIVDQVDALEKSSSNTDTILYSDKETVQKLINSLSVGNFLITSASANYQTARYMAQKQAGEKRMSVVGGMSNEEMMQWWKHHESKLPRFKDEREMSEIEDFTGCIPLLLRPLLEFDQQDFCAAENDFWSSSEITAVRLNIEEFADEKSKLGEQLYSDYVDTLFNCLTYGDAPSNLSESFDYRYFYHNDISGVCACGAARAAAAVIIGKWKISRFYEPNWLDSLFKFKDNPFTLGFQIEKVCLGCIANIGLDYGGKHMDPKIPTWFRGNKIEALLGAIPSSDPSGLYFPLDPQFEDLDALVLEYHPQTNTLHVIPIRVSISKKHKDSETLFYNKWKKWESKFPGVELKSTFIWIVEKTKSIEGEVQDTRTTTHVKSRDHDQVYLSAEDVHRPLGEALGRIRYLQYQDSLPKKFLEILTNGD